jgi:hypothetical protein
MRFESGVITMLARLAANGLGTAAQMAVVTGKDKAEFLREAAEFFDEAEKTAALGEWAASLGAVGSTSDEPSPSSDPLPGETTLIKKL